MRLSLPNQEARKKYDPASFRQLMCQCEDWPARHGWQVEADAACCAGRPAAQYSARRCCGSRWRALWPARAARAWRAPVRPGDTPTRQGQASGGARARAAAGSRPWTCQARRHLVQPRRQGASIDLGLLVKPGVHVRYAGVAGFELLAEARARAAAGSRLLSCRARRRRGSSMSRARNGGVKSVLKLSAG